MAKSAQEKAQEALEVAERKLAKTTAKREAAEAAIVTLKAEEETQRESVDYLKAHPALKSLEDSVAEAQQEPVPDEQRPSLGF